MSSFGLSYAPSETLGFIPERLERLTDNHGSPGRGEKGSRRLHADRPPRQGRLSGLCRRIAPRRAGNDQGRDLPHLFDDQADRFGRRDDAGRGGTAPDHRSRLEIHPGLRQREGRRRQRRQARSCAAQAADHRPGPHAPHVGADLWLHRGVAGPEADQGGERREFEPDVGRKCRCDGGASAHASAGRGLGVQPVHRRARARGRNRRRRSPRRSRYSSACSGPSTWSTPPSSRPSRSSIGGPIRSRSTS